MSRFTFSAVVLTCCLILSLGPAGPAPAVIMVNSLADDGSGGCTLREAVMSANTDTNTGGCVNTVAYDSGLTDQIKFSLAGTVTLQSAITVTEPITVTGFVLDDPHLLTTIRTAGNFRAFVVNVDIGTARLDAFYLAFTGDDLGQGGGISNLGGSLLLNQCIMTGGSNILGGAVSSTGGNLQISNCIIAGNRATGTSGVPARGGGIYSSNTLFNLINSTVSGNYAAAAGGGIYINSYGATFPSILQSTIAGNRTAGDGGGLWTQDVHDMTIKDSIFWGNRGGADNQISVNGTTSLEVSYCDIEGGDPANPATPWPGLGNLLVAPQFISLKGADLAPTTAGNYHLKHTSPCINVRATCPECWTMDQDLDGRNMDGAGWDIGADEAGPPFNDGFEYDPSLPPAPWTGANLGPDDGRDTDIKYSGRASFRMVGSGLGKNVHQAFNVTGLTNDRIFVTAFSRARLIPAGGKYRLSVKIYYNDGTTELVKTDWPTGNHGWLKGFADRRNIAKPYHRLLVTLSLTKPAGTAWFDEVKVHIYR